MADASDRDGFVCDVLVVGSGAAGLTAAITARKAGLEVIVLEKAACFGGTSATSGGTVWIPVNHLESDIGIEDSEADARTYLEQTVGNHWDEARISAFLKAAPEMVRFLERETEVKFVAERRPEYYPSLPGSGSGRALTPAEYDVRSLGPAYRQLRPMLSQTLFAGIAVGSSLEMKKYFSATRSARSLSFVAGRLLRHAVDTLRYGRSSRLPRGAALVARLARSAFDLGIPLWLSSAARRPLLDGGRVAGLEVQTSGRTVSVYARRGVVLACGGFPRDLARTRSSYRHLGQDKAHASPTPDGNTGDGIRIAEAAGGQFTDDVAEPAAWMPMSIIPGRTGSGAAYPHMVDRQKPGFIAVTTKGLRFANEAGPYHEFVQAMIRAGDGEPGLDIYLICDRRAIDRWGLGFVKPFPVPRAAHLRSGYLLRGLSLAELATQAAIDPAALHSTIETFNLHARMGVDPQFHRGESDYDRSFGDPNHGPNPTLRPLEHPPFFAVRLVPGEIATFAGLRTDASARVLGRDGQPVQGLYAVGNDMASIMGGAYPAAGITLGPGMTFGYLAGRHLATLSPGDASIAVPSTSADTVVSA